MMRRKGTDLFEPLYQCEGSGTLQVTDRAPMKTSFTFEQHQDGQMYFSCGLPQGANLWQLRNDNLGWNEIKCSFEGVTNEKLLLEIPELRSEGNRGSLLDFVTTKATLTALDEENKPYESQPFSARVPLTNYWFSPEPIERHIFENGFAVEGQQMPLRLEEQDLTICYRFPPKVSIQEVKEKRGTAVLCDAFFPQKDWPQADFKDTMSVLCSLLTFLSDTHVGWLGYDIYDAEGRLLKRFCLANPTSEFTGNVSGPLWSATPWIQSEPEFLQQAFARYNQVWDDWDIYSVINLFTELRGYNGYAEVAGLQLALCAELMVDQYLRRTKKKEILGSSRKDKLESGVRGIIKEQFSSMVANLSTSSEIDVEKQKEELHQKQELMIKNVPALNNHPFSVALDQVCTELAFQPGEEALTRFKRSRNTLVHTGLFSFKGAGGDGKQLTPRERWDLYGDRVEERYNELRFMEDFVGVLIFHALGGKKELQGW